jgi:hypothetical protein
MSVGNLTGKELSVSKLTANTITVSTITANTITANSINSSGLYSVGVNDVSAVISIPGLTTNGIVNLAYIHPNIGGAGQYFKNYTPSTNTLTVELGQAGGANEKIIWSVAQF